jgi:hypothetical protein
MIWRKEDAIFAEKAIRMWDGPEQRYARTVERLRAAVVVAADQLVLSVISRINPKN